MLNRFVLSALILLPSSLVGAQQSTAPVSPVSPVSPAAPVSAARAGARGADVARGPLAASPSLAGFEPARGEWSARVPQDPADSLYREARSQLNRGEPSRSFFGVLRVLESENGTVRRFLHGTTRHGAQRLTDRKSVEARRHSPRFSCDRASR